MDQIPGNLVITVAREHFSSIQSWWNSLSEEDKHEIYNLCIEQDSCTLVSLEDELQSFESKQFPIISGHFESPDKARPNLEWYQDMYEYLVAHPEVKLAAHLEPKVFHICTAHEKAREVIQSGVIPENFKCPLEDNACLMKNILKEVPGKSLVLMPLKSSEKCGVD
jgi:hypothetical protein